MVAYLHAGLENGVSPANRMVEGPESPRKGDLCQQHLKASSLRRGEAQNHLDRRARLVGANKAD